MQTQSKYRRSISRSKAEALERILKYSWHVFQLYAFPTRTLETRKLKLLKEVAKYMSHK